MAARLAGGGGGDGMDFSDYRYLLFERRPHGVLLITINRPDRLNATDTVLHSELCRVWPEVSADAETHVAVITGAGRAFSAGGDLAMVQQQVKSFPRVAAVMKEAGDLVYNIINCEKPVISAINGVAVGAGLAVALMADISIMAEEARITDGHIRLGVGAGDHAAIIWPLLCGMAKAKYYLLTAEFIDGREAERIGLVSRCVPGDRLMTAALEVAEKLATGPQLAIRWTKRALNNWLRTAGPIFDTSLALEMLSFFDEDVVEGAAAILEKRPPKFPSAR
jgi:enoyl-CoA hydratase/carnithine racemase